MNDVTKPQIEVLFDAMMEAEFEFIAAASPYYLGPCGDSECCTKTQAPTEAHDRMDEAFFTYADARLAHNDAEEAEPARVG